MFRRFSAAAAAIAAVFALVLPATAHAQQFGWVVSPTADEALGINYAPADITMYVTLADGRVLAAGGAGNTSAAILDLAGQWTPTGHMNKSRAYATAIRLNDGRVLAIGGHDYRNSEFGVWLFGQHADAELYDPATGQWTLVDGAMSNRRSNARAVVMKDGRVLVVGGNFLTGDGGWYPFGLAGTSSVDIFDPATNSWVPAQSMSNWHNASAADLFQVFLLGDGRIVAWDYVLWGYQFPEIYNPATNSWDWFWGAVQGTPVALPDGRLMLVVPGWDYGAPQTATRIFDPVTNAWSDGPPVPQFRTGDRFISLPDGKVLMAGGYYYEQETYEYEGSQYTYWAGRGGTTWTFDTAQNAWSSGPSWKLTTGQPLSEISYDFTMVLPMAQGRMFYTGGARYRPVTPPVAVSPNLTLNGTTGVPGLYTLDAGGSYDPDNDALTGFRWTVGDTVLSEGANASQQMLLGVGTHTLMLTVTDRSGQTGTTLVTIVIQDSAAAAWSAYESCSTSLTAAQGALAPLNAALAAANATIATLQAELAKVQQMMSSALGDPSFVVPGATPGEQLTNVTTAISKLNPGQKKALADAISGKKQ